MCWDDKVLRYYTWKHIVIVEGFIVNQMYKVLLRNIFWCHTVNVYFPAQKDLYIA